MLVKICGLKTLATVEAAVVNGADLLGFVFFRASPRNIGLSRARALGAVVRGRAAKVALSVDAEDALLEGIVAALEPDILQLHGKESPQRVTAVKRRFGLPVMKALHLETAADLGSIAVYARVADRLLFDARPPAAANRPGGLGRSFDWRLLEKLDPGVPFMLSGGLNPANVAVALAITGAPGVDVSSGVERAPGEKDIEKIRLFIRAAREAART